MAQQIKRPFSVVLAIAIIFSVLTFSPMTTSASTDYEWEVWSNSQDTKFSASPEAGTFIIENTDYTAWARFERLLNIESAGRYQVSVELKVENFQPNPNPAFAEYFPALILWGINDGNSYDNSLWSISHDEWVTLLCQFDANDNDIIRLVLSLGVGKGKITFRNVKLEKMEVVSSSTEWNVLAVFFNELDITIPQQSTGQETERIHERADEAKIDFYKSVLEIFPDFWEEIVGGRSTIKNIDIIDISNPFTKGDNFFNYSPFQGIINVPRDYLPFIETKLLNNHYDKVLIFLPSDSDAAGGGGALYRNGVWTYFSDYPYWEIDEERLLLLMTHELLHCVEARADIELGIPRTNTYRVENNITWLHMSENYGYTPYPYGGYEWYRDFAQNLLPDKSGLPAEAFVANRYGVVANIPLDNITFSQNANVTLLDRNLNPILIAPNLDTASTWAHDNINEAYNKNLIPSTFQDNYTDNTTRAEFAALAVLLYETVTGKVIEADVNRFTDTNDINAAKAASIGVTAGTGDGSTFSPDVLLNREQAATMLSRLANAIGQPLPEHTATFVDNEQVSSWAVEAVGQMQTTGIMGGVGGNRFAPSEPYTREQSIITILRLFNIVS
jgi:hypothetical protein